MTLGMRLAELESLGEIDLSRAIYVHTSNYTTFSHSNLWQKRNDFEIQHDNEDTFLEMLRINHTEPASHSQPHFILPDYLMQRGRGEEQAIGW